MTLTMSPVLGHGRDTWKNLLTMLRRLQRWSDPLGWVLIVVEAAGVLASIAWPASEIVAVPASLVACFVALAITGRRAGSYNRTVILFGLVASVLFISHMRPISSVF